MTEHYDPQPRPLEYRVGTDPLNAFQRASILALRVIGLLFLAYAAAGIIGLVAGAAVRMDIYPIGRHLVGICEYGLLGMFAAVFSRPVGRWLGAAA